MELYLVFISVLDRNLYASQDIHNPITLNPEYARVVTAEEIEDVGAGLVNYYLVNWKQIQIRNFHGLDVYQEPRMSQITIHFRTVFSFKETQ